MSKLAVLGNKDFIELFTLIGADGFLAEGGHALKENLDLIFKDDYAVLIVPEAYLENVEILKKDLDKRDFPIVLSVPDCRGSLGISKRRLGQFIRKATGTTIFSDG